MKKTLLVASVATLLLSACGGSETGKNDQPWLGDGSPPGSEVPANLPPKISGVPTDKVSVVFGQSEQLALTATDPEGKPVTLSLSGAPSWVTMDTSGLITLAPKIMVDGEFIILASDGVNTVSSQAIRVDVLAPSVIEYMPVAPEGSKSGDVFSLSFVAPTGEVTSFTTVLNGEETLPLQIPFPYDQELDQSQVVTHWDPSQRGLVPYQRWAGPVASLYTDLDETLTIPQSKRSAHVPTALSSAYLHGLHQRGQDLSRQSAFTVPTAHQTVGAESSSSLLKLAAIFQLAHHRDELSDFNKALAADYATERTDVGLGMLLDEIDAIRRGEGALINDRYWSDLLSQTIGALEKPVFAWSAGRSQLLVPVDARFGSGFGQTLDLKEDGSYQIRGQSLPWLTGSQGTWQVQGKDLLLSYSPHDVSVQKVEIPYEADPVLLRERLMSTLNISFEHATHWVDIADQKKWSTLQFSVEPASRLEISPVIDSMSGERPVMVSAVGTVRFVDAELEAEYIGQRVERIWRVVPNQQPTYFEHRNEIYDVVLPWPLDTGELGLDAFNWLSLYDAPVVRERISMVGQGVTERAIAWTAQYDPDQRKFSFSSEAHPSGSLSYTVSLSGTPLIERKETEVHNSRRYAGHAELRKDGALMYEGPVSMSLVPKSRCEVSSRCEPSDLYQSNALWVDSQWGAGGAQSGLVYLAVVDPAEPAKTQHVMQPVRTGASCVGEVSSCLVSDGVAFTLQAQSVSGKTVWKRSGEGQVAWHPIQVSRTSFTVWPERGVPVHRKHTAVDPAKALWRCSYVNPDVTKVFGGTDQAAKDALLKSCGRGAL
jgi:hypothetical protein